MITLLLVMILLVLLGIANGLRTLNDNLIHFGRQAKTDATSQVLLLRGIKAVGIEMADSKLKGARNL